MWQEEGPFMATKSKKKCWPLYTMYKNVLLKNASKNFSPKMPLTVGYFTGIIHLSHCINLWARAKQFGCHSVVALTASAERV